MSLLSPVIRGLSTGPKWQYDGHHFSARTPALLRVLTLFAYDRRLLVSRPAKMMRLTVTRWWFFRTVVELPTQRVRSVLYGYKDIGTSWSFSPFWMGRLDTVEKFRVGVALAEPAQNLDLYTFVGEGSQDTGWPGVILGGDDVVDVRGPQEQQSRHFVDRLCHALGVQTLGAWPAWSA